MNEAESTGPKRAHSLVLSAGADTLEMLCADLRHIARQLERGEITRGCMGGPSSGYLYSYIERPEQTHDEYFRQVDEWLRARSEQT